MRTSRREFLQALGVTAGGVAAAGSARAGAEQAGRDLGLWTQPEERWTPSVCEQCPGGCGLLVRALDGVAVGLRGNPHHPVNRGAVCAKAFGALQATADPGRYPGPLLRDGERGSGRFRPVGWEEALGLLARRLGDLRQQGLAHTVAVLGGQYRGCRDVLWQRFARAYGTPNYVRARCLAPERPALAHRLMHGVGVPVAYDLGRAGLVLCFGVGLLESWVSPVHAGRALAELRGGPERERGMLIVVDPRRSLSAAAADRWVPIRPGTDGILALGLANVLLREDLYDRAFVDAHTLGFREFTDGAGRRHRGFRDLVLQDYGPLVVSEATGVPVETIIAVARALARHRPAVVLGERGPAFGPGDLPTRLAIHALNALLGNLGVEGGLTVSGALPLGRLDEVKTDPVAERGAAAPRLDAAGRGDDHLATDAPQALPARILSGAPYPVNAVLAFATNPVASHPAGEAFARALGRVPLVVSFSPFPDETSRLADMILPDQTFLERWQDDPVAHLPGFACWSLGRPAARPRGQARNAGDVLLALARALGGPVAESLPWAKYEDLLYETGTGLFEAEGGHVVAPPEEEWVRRVQARQGYWNPEFESYDDFWEALGTRGAWWEPAEPAASRRAVMPGGVFRFYPVGPRGEVVARPEPPAPAAGEAAFPFVLNTYRLATRPQGGGRNQPWLMESPAGHVDGAWRSWVELHPDDARPLGVASGHEVWVESPRGRLRLSARVHDGSARGVVHVPLFGAGAENPNVLLADVPDPTRGMGLFGATRVRIRKA